MLFHGYTKVDICPMDELGISTPCRSFLRNKYGLECSKYCPDKIVNAEDAVKKRLFHTLCLTDENHPSSLNAILRYRSGSSDGYIYPQEFYKDEYKNS